MRKPATAATALFMIALPLVGCGGDTVDKNAYVKSVTAVQSKTAADAQKLSTEMSSAKTPAAIASKLTELGKAVDADADQLAKIKVPTEVTAEHASYVKLMQKFASELEGLAPQVEKATPTSVGKVLQQASDYTADLSKNEATIVGNINSKLQN